MEKYEIQKVQCLRYKLIHLKPVEFSTNETEYTFENDNVLFILKEDMATVVIKKNTNSIEEAKKIASQYINGLETIWHIKYAEKYLKFEFIHADIVVVYPSSGEIRTKRRLESTGTYEVVESDPPAIKLTLRSDQDALLVTSPTALLLANRYKQYLQKQESLSSMGYYCFTVIKDCIEKATPNGKYFIDSKVLKTLSKLTSLLGDSKTARKLLATRPHTKIETDWIERTINVIMVRIGQVDSDPDSDIRRISMSNLPNLEQ